LTPFPIPREPIRLTSYLFANFDFLPMRLPTIVSGCNRASFFSGSPDPATPLPEEPFSSDETLFSCARSGIEIRSPSQRRTIAWRNAQPKEDEGWSSGTVCRKFHRFRKQPLRHCRRKWHPGEKVTASAGLQLAPFGRVSI
jgi:hypothetical protein